MGIGLEIGVPLIGFTGYEDEKNIRYFCGIKDIPEAQLYEYVKILNNYFGESIKDFDVQVNEKTVPEFYIKYLNEMNGILFGGIAINSGLVTLGNIVDVLVQQHGGCKEPPINLANSQSFYGKSNDKLNRVELARICPHASGDQATIEYMVSFNKISQN